MIEIFLISFAIIIVILLIRFQTKGNALKYLNANFSSKHEENSSNFKHNQIFYYGEVGVNRSYINDASIAFDKNSVFVKSSFLTPWFKQYEFKLGSLVPTEEFFEITTGKIQIFQIEGSSFFIGFSKKSWERALGRSN